MLNYARIDVQAYNYSSAVSAMCYLFTYDLKTCFLFSVSSLWSVSLGNILHAREITFLFGWLIFLSRLDQCIFGFFISLFISTNIAFNMKVAPTKHFTYTNFSNRFSLTGKHVCHHRRKSQCHFSFVKSHSNRFSSGSVLVSTVLAFVLCYCGRE